MKKIISIFLAVAFMFSVCICANAETGELKFGSDGKFTILQISDPQDDHNPAYDLVEFLKLSIDETNPDLIIFTGDIVEDNRGGDVTSDAEPFREGVKADDYNQCFENISKTCEAVFGYAEEKGIPFAVSQGNNDYKGGITNEDWLKIYDTYKNSLTVDESNDKDGRIDFNLEIKSSDGKETVFNIWMSDNGGGSITEEQLAWYKSESAALKEANGGQPVPAFLFQHCPVDEMGNFFEECNFWDEGASIGDDGKCYRLNQDIASGYHAGVMLPGSSTEQFKAWKECGDVIGAYFGHWHTEGYTGTWDGIELGFTYGCEFAKPGPYGIRVFTLYEDDIKNYDNVLYTYEGSVKTKDARLELQENKPYTEYNNAIEEFFAAIKNVFILIKTEIISSFA